MPTSPATRPDQIFLTRLLSHDNVWHRCGDGLYTLSLHYDSSEYTWLTLTKQDLHDIDSRLPRLLDYFLDGLCANRETTAMRICASVAFWKNGGVPYTGGDYVGDVLVTRIEALCSHQQDGVFDGTGVGPSVSMLFTGYKLDEMPDGTEYVRYILRRQEFVPAEWLEQHFPGSVALMHIALELGLTSAEVARYATISQSVEAAVLPDTVVGPTMFG